MNEIRESVRGLIVKEDKSIILIHRIKKGKEYRVLPGGGRNEGEELEETLYREISEELGNVKIEWKGFLDKIQVNILDILNYEYIYLGEYIHGDINSGNGVEYTECSNPTNYYNPEFIQKDDIRDKNILPEETKKLIIDVLAV